MSAGQEGGGVVADDDVPGIDDVHGTDDVPGIDDVPGLGRWLGENGVTATGTRPRVRLIAGGRSNLTYLLEPGEADARLVLRRPPLGPVLPTAHDMSRE